MTNKLTWNVTEEQWTQISSSIDTLTEVLPEHLISLTVKERKEIPRMGDGTTPFVEKSLDYAQTYPEFVPPYLDVQGFKTDFEIVKKLGSLLMPLTTLLQQIEDSHAQAGSEAYVAALNYYNTLKAAAKLGIANAEPIHNELKQRFTKSRTKKTPPTDSSSNEE